MADKRISELNTGTPLADADLLPVAQETSPGVYSTIKATLANLRTHLLATFSDLFVNTSGDTMTGPLNGTSAAFSGGVSAASAAIAGTVTLSNGADTATVAVISGGDLNITPDDNNHIVYINAATADAGNTGQLITGRFRFSVPVSIVAAATNVVQSGPTGSGTALVRCSRPTPITVTIRENDGTAGADWHKGNFCSFMQEGTGQITIAPASANVVLNYPASLSLKSREQYSIITATLYDITGAVETWVISGDLEPAP